MRICLAFGANAFYRIDGIATALQRMHQAVRRRVTLAQTVGQPHANPLSVTCNGQVFTCERAAALNAALDELGTEHRH